MAELRSFVIGVAIAGALLLAAGLAFGLFSGDSSGSPSVRLLGTPPATRTPAPAATRPPTEFTPVTPANNGAPPIDTPTEQTPAGENPNGSQQPEPTQPPVTEPTATPTLEIAPTQVPTEVPTEEPTEVPTESPSTNELVAYVDSANEYTPPLVANIEYLVGNVNAPNMADESWRTFTQDAATTIQGLAGSLASLYAPDCVSSAHGTLVAAANQASAAAGTVIAAVEAEDSVAAAGAGGSLVSARDSINSAVATVSAAVASC